MRSIKCTLKERFKDSKIKKKKEGIEEEWRIKRKEKRLEGEWKIKEKEKKKEH